MVSLGIVVAEFDKTGEVIPAMEQAARASASANGAEIRAIQHVPGSYDTPLAADKLARRDGIDAVAVLGAIVTGETNHDQIIAHAAAKGLTDVSLRRDTPVTLGILGPGMTESQARARVDYAAQAVTSAIDLAEAYES